MFAIVRVIAAVSVCLGSAGLNRAAAKSPANPLLGCWRSDKGTYIRFEAERIAVVDPRGILRFYFAKYTDSGSAKPEIKVDFHGPFNGVAKTFRAQVRDDVLTVDQCDILPKSPLHKLNAPPPELELQPLKLGEAKPLSRGMVRTIKRELARRAASDQSVRLRDHNDLDLKQKSQQIDKAKMRQIDADNIDYLINLIRKVGWIDAERFGSIASGNAALIIQHSANLPLMAATMPEIAKEVKAHRFAIPAFYAMMVFRFQELQAKKMGPKERAHLKELGLDMP